MKTWRAVLLLEFVVLGSLLASGPGAEAAMEVDEEGHTGRWTIREGGKPVLTYNYHTNEPGPLLAKIQPENLKYARPRGDYIHPLYGPDGEALTQDWSVDHPHHRGIYWAWPEVDFGGERGDLHALQRVFARPTGHCAGQSGEWFAKIEAENVWLWEDREPIVREVSIIRVNSATTNGRAIDLEFAFTALKEGVTVARRDSSHYGGFNMRLSSVGEQKIAVHRDLPGAQPRMNWGQISGVFAGGKQPVGLAVLEHPANPHYPGDWIQYPALNWLQPAFPSAGTRYALKTSQPLVLRFRLWISAGPADERKLAALWTDYAR